MGIKAAIARTLSAIGTVLVNTAAHIGAANGGSGASRFLSGAHHDGRLARRGHPKHCARAVDCVVLDQWLMWRN